MLSVSVLPPSCISNPQTLLLSLLLLLLVHILEQVASFVDWMALASIDIFIDFPSLFPVDNFHNSIVLQLRKCCDLLHSNEDIQFSIPLLWNRRRDREAMGKCEERVEV